MLDWQFPSHYGVWTENFVISDAWQKYVLLRMTAPLKFGIGKVCVRAKWSIKYCLSRLLYLGWDTTLVHQYPFIHLSKERHNESKVSGLRTQHNSPRRSGVERTYPEAAAPPLWCLVWLDKTLREQKLPLALSQLHCMTNIIDVKKIA